MLTNNDYEQLLDFSMQLSNKEEFSSSNVLEEKILKLLDYMFGFNSTVFTKFNDSNLKPQVNDIMGRNIDKEMIKAYREYYVYKDIFILSQYWRRGEENSHWRNLNNKKIVTINDICTYDNYESSEYYKFLGKANIYYQMVLTINDSSDVLNIFKKKEEGDFTIREHMLAEKICKIVTDKYNLLKRNNNLIKEINVLKNSTENMPFGLLVFDDEFNIVEFNKSAIEYCSNITKQRHFDDIIKDSKELIYETIIQNENNEEDTYVLNSKVYKYKLIENYMISVSSISKLTSDNIFKKNNIVYIHDTNWLKKSNKIDRFTNTYNLTKREIDVAKLICEGLSNKEISDRLFISTHTVKSHIDNIFKKIGVNSRTSIIVKLNKSLNQNQKIIV